MVANGLRIRLNGKQRRSSPRRCHCDAIRRKTIFGRVAFTMLHHVPSRDLQDKLLREVGECCGREEFSWAAIVCKAGSCG